MIIIPAIIVAIIAAFIYSQYSFSCQLKTLQNDVIRLENELKFLKTSFSFQDEVIPTDFTPSGIIIIEKALFDSYGLIQIVLCMLVQFFELWSTTNANSLIYEQKLYIHFIFYNIPISSSFIFALTYILAWVSYFNFIPNTTFYDWFAKFLIIWNMSIFSTNSLNNFIRISRYFPSSYEGWKSKLMDRTWWWWVCSRTLNIDTIESAIGVSITIVTRLFLIWPFRYFFYYSSTCSSISATHAVLINIIAHTSAICCWSYITQLSAYGTVPSFSRYFLTISADAELYFACIFCGYNLLLTLIRCGWIWLYSGCTWWGWLLITPMFFFIQFVIVFLTTPILFASAHKKGYYKGFHDKLATDEVKHHLGQDNISESKATDAFCEILDAATRLFVFNPDLIHKQKVNFQTGEKEENDSESVLFEKMFQHAFMNHSERAQQEAQEGAQEEKEGPKEDEGEIPAGFENSAEEENKEDDDDDLLEPPSSKKQKQK